MALLSGTKINKLLRQCPLGSVATSCWLKKHSISRQLQAHYQKSGWFEAIGRGAYKRTGDTINWEGGLYALQKQEELDIHIGGLTAISLHGAGHYIRFNEYIQLFISEKVRLPSWFKNYNWQTEIALYHTCFLPKDVALIEYEDRTFNLTTSTLERAFFECLYLAPKYIDLVECYHILESLIGLRPNILQELLNKCSSIKVKRLFLYMAEKVKHTWLDFIDIKSINIGKGKRSIIKHEAYDAKYQITIPKELSL